MSRTRGRPGPAQGRARVTRRIASVCLDEKPGGTRPSRVRPPDVDPRLDPRFRADRMRLALVAGVHPDANDRRWVLVARGGSATAAFCEARLFPFTKAGKARGLEAARGLRFRQERPADWTSFVARVLVEGPWNRPSSVTPAWVIEGLERPAPVDYYFD